MSLRYHVSIALGVLAIVFAPAGANAAEIGPAEICKASFAMLMGRNPATMSSEKTADGVIQLRYVRDGGSLWAYRCRVSGSSVVWATSDGRWRDAPGDEKLTYTISADRQSITVSESTGIWKSFKAADF